MKWMIASDFQIPYQDDRATALFFEVMKWFKPDVVDLPGDISDQACWSRWTDGTSADFVNAIKKSNSEPILPFVFEQEKPVAEFYEKVRKTRPKAEIFTELGNHDIRAWLYFDKKAPEIVEHITPESLWRLDSLGIDYIHYDDAPVHRYGDIYVHHGMSISKHSGESVRNDVGDFGVSLVRGHSHRAATYYRTMPLREETLRGYEIGHMSDIKSKGMSYINNHNWQLAFMIGHIESGCTFTKDGYYPHFQLVHINQDYECYVDGKLFKG